jgi:hypothetical protein
MARYLLASPVSITRLADICSSHRVPNLFAGFVPPYWAHPLLPMPDQTAPLAADEFSPAVLAQLRRLQQRYAADGQDLAAYLEGLYHADYINYWDYIELDTLLSLQRI